MTNISNGGSTRRRKILVSVNLSRNLSAGESIRLLRGGSQIGSQQTSTSTTTFTWTDYIGYSQGDTLNTAYTVEFTPVSGSTATSPAFTINFIDSLRSCVLAVVDNNGNGYSYGQTIDQAADSLMIYVQVDRNLEPGMSVSVFRDGQLRGTASDAGEDRLYVFQEAVPTTSEFAYSSRLDNGSIHGAMSRDYPLAVEAPPTPSGSYILMEDITPILDEVDGLPLLTEVQ